MGVRKLGCSLNLKASKMHVLFACELIFYRRVVDLEGPKGSFMALSLSEMCIFTPRVAMAAVRCAGKIGSTVPLILGNTSSCFGSIYLPGQAHLKF